MMEIVEMIKIDYRDKRIITELHEHQKTSIKIKECKREAVIREGERQGCNLSPLLFNIYIEKAINEYKEYCTGIKMDGVGVQMVRLADHTPIIAQNGINLKRALDSLEVILKRYYEMEINRIKTEVMVCSKNPENTNIKMDDDPLKVRFPLYATKAPRVGRGIALPFLRSRH